MMGIRRAEGRTPQVGEQPVQKHRGRNNRLRKRGIWFWLGRKHEGWAGTESPVQRPECQAKGLHWGARKAFVLQGTAGLRLTFPLALPLHWAPFLGPLLLAPDPPAPFLRVVLCCTPFPPLHTLCPSPPGTSFASSTLQAVAFILLTQQKSFDQQTDYSVLLYL